MNNQLDPVTGQGQFQVGPVPSGDSLPVGIIPQWTSSDVTVATVETPNSDSTGDTTKVSRVGSGSITLSVALTLADGTVLSDSVVVAVPPAAVPPLTGLSITQIA
jgi:hypothetical protein